LGLGIRCQVAEPSRSSHHGMSPAGVIRPLTALFGDPWV